jgi:GTP cyclohydrolase I
MLEQQPLTPALLRNVLQRFLDSHEDLSKNAYLRIHTDLLLKRPALVSPGWLESLSGEHRSAWKTRCSTWN